MSEMPHMEFAIAELIAEAFQHARTQVTRYTLHLCDELLDEYSDRAELILRDADVLTEVEVQQFLHGIRQELRQEIKDGCYGAV